MTCVKPLLLAYSPRLTSGLSLGRNATDIDAYMVRALPSSGTLNLARPTVVLLDRQLVAGVAELGAQLHALSRVAALVWCNSSDEECPPSDVPIELLTNVIPYEAPIPTAVALLREAMRRAVTLRAEREAHDETPGVPRDEGDRNDGRATDAPAWSTGHSGSAHARPHRASRHAPVCARNR